MSASEWMKAYTEWAPVNVGDELVGGIEMVGSLTRDDGQAFVIVGVCTNPVDGVHSHHTITWTMTDFARDWHEWHDEAPKAGWTGFVRYAGDGRYEPHFGEPYENEESSLCPLVAAG